MRAGSPLGPFVAQLDHWDNHPEDWEDLGVKENWRMPVVFKWQRMPGLRVVASTIQAFRFVWRVVFVWGDSLPLGWGYDAWVLWGLKEGRWR